MVKFSFDRSSYSSSRKNKPQDPRSIDRYIVKMDIKDGTMLISTDGTEHRVPILQLPKKTSDTSELFKKLSI